MELSASGQTSARDAEAAMREGKKGEKTGRYKRRKVESFAFAQMIRQRAHPGSFQIFKCC